MFLSYSSTPSSVWWWRWWQLL